MTDTELSELNLGVPVEDVRELLDALQSEGELMTPDKVRTLVDLWRDFSAAYRASWLIPQGLLGNFAGWLVNAGKVAP